jgi:hypothetical protein
MIHTHLSACPKTPEVDSNVTLGALSARPKTPEVESNVILGALSARLKTPKLECIKPSI